MDLIIWKKVIFFLLRPGMKEVHCYLFQIGKFSGIFGIFNTDFSVKCCANEGILEKQQFYWLMRNRMREVKMYYWTFLEDLCHSTKDFLLKSSEKKSHFFLLRPGMREVHCYLFQIGKFSGIFENFNTDFSVKFCPNEQTLWKTAISLTYAP